MQTLHFVKMKLINKQAVAHQQFNTAQHTICGSSLVNSSFM